MQARSQIAEVAKAEASPEDCRLGEAGLRLVWESRRSALDQRPDRRREHPLGVAGQRPDAVDLLDQTGISIGTRLLGEDEGNAFGLRVHHGGTAEVHPAAEDLLEELGRLKLAEAA